MNKTTLTDNINDLLAQCDVSRKDLIAYTFKNKQRRLCVYTKTNVLHCRRNAKKLDYVLVKCSKFF